MSKPPTRIWIEAKTKTALSLAKLARLLDEETVGPTEMAQVIMDSLDVILTGIERIDHLISQEPVVRRSPIFQYFDRSRMMGAIDTFNDLWADMGQALWISKEKPVISQTPKEIWRQWRSPDDAIDWAGNILPASSRSELEQMFANLQPNRDGKKAPVWQSYIERLIDKDSIHY